MIADMTSGTVIFRTDASVAIGGGHVMRCLALADALAAQGWRCGFAVCDQTPHSLPALAAANHDVAVLECPADDEPAALAARWPDGVDWLIIDHYGRDADFERACRPWARRVMVIDDLADRPHDCDLLLDQTLGRCEGDYAAFVPTGCRLVLGPSYALLRPQFAAARSTALARRAQNGSVRRLLIAMGVGDPSNVTSVVLEGIARAGLDLVVSVVLGGVSPHLDAVRRRLETLPQGGELRVAVADIAPLMVEADLAIGAAGTSTWERCCLGLPTLMIVLAANQRMIAESVASAGAAQSLGALHEIEADDIGRALNGLAGDSARRRAMSAAAAEVCDGRGVARVVEGMAA